MPPRSASLSVRSEMIIREVTKVVDIKVSNNKNIMIDFRGDDNKNSAPIILYQRIIVYVYI